MDIDQKNEEMAAERVKQLRDIASQIRSGVTEAAVMEQVKDMQSEITFDRAFFGLGAHAVDEALCLDDWLTARGGDETLTREDQETIKRLVDRAIKQSHIYATIGRNAARDVFREGHDLDVLVDIIEQRCPKLPSDMRRVLMSDSQPSRLKAVSEALRTFTPSTRNGWSGRDAARADAALTSYIEILKTFGFTVTDPDGHDV